MDLHDEAGNDTTKSQIANFPMILSYPNWTQKLPQSFNLQSQQWPAEPCAVL